MQQLIEQRLDAKTTADTASASTAAAATQVDDKTRADQLKAYMEKILSETIPGIVHRMPIVNISRHVSVFKIAIDFSKLQYEDTHYVFTYLTFLPKNFLHLDLLDCQLEKSSDLSNILSRLDNLGTYSKFQTFHLITQPNPHEFSTLTPQQESLLARQYKLNGDFLAEKRLVESLTKSIQGDRLFLMSVRDLATQGLNRKGFAFLKAWQDPISLDIVQNGNGIEKLLGVYNRLKIMIEGRFCLEKSRLGLNDNFTNFFLGEKGIFVFTDNALKKIIIEQKRYAEHDIYYILECITWIAIVFERLGIHRQYPVTTEAIHYANFIKNILMLSDKPLKTKIFRMFYGSIQSVEQQIHLNFFLRRSNDRLYIISFLISVLGRDIDRNELGDYLKPPASYYTLPDFFKNPLYREGSYNRLVIETLLKLAQDKKLSAKTKIFLVSHCQSILMKYPNDKRKHHEIWSLLYSLLCCNLSKEIENFINENKERSEKEDILNDLYNQFIKKKLALSDDDMKAYKEHFDQPNHHLVLAFRQNLASDDERDAKPWDEFIQTVTKKGFSGYRALRYDETRNAHLKTAFDSPEGQVLKSKWITCNMQYPIPDGPFKGHYAYCTDHFWDFFTWGMDFNCLTPTNGDGKHMSHLLDGRHRLLLLRNSKGTVIAGCLLHLLLQDVESPKPCLAIARFYFRKDRIQSIEKSIFEKNALFKIFDKLTISIAIQMNIPAYCLFSKGDAAKEQRDISLTTGDSLFSKDGPFPGPIGTIKYRTGFDSDFIAGEAITNPKHGAIVVIPSYQTIFTPTPPIPLGAKDILKTIFAVERNSEKYNPDKKDADETGILRSIDEYGAVPKAVSAGLHFEWDESVSSISSVNAAAAAFDRKGGAGRAEQLRLFTLDQMVKGVVKDEGQKQGPK